MAAPVHLGDPKSARARGQTSIDFKSAQTGVASKAMRNELNKLADTIKDAETKRAFDAEMQSFFLLFNRYLTDKAKGTKIVWDKIQPIGDDKVVPYSQLKGQADPAALNKLAVLKLNGGLGTTMGCVGPKSVIEVREGMTFLDLSVRQIEHLNSAYNANVPFILMNSFNTDEDTARIIQKYANHNIDIITFNQSRFPRINRDSLLPVPRTAQEDKGGWYPPGHGDIFDACTNSGLVERLLAAGKEYLFVSNSDNLGAVTDLNILQHMIESQAEFLMEVTDKTKADVKGGTLIDYDGQIRLLEIAQVPSDHVEDFKSVRKFKIFNTNSLWLDLKAVKRVMDGDGLDLEIIVNPKVTDSGEAVIQLETASGAAIKHFRNAHGVNVPRSRFLPVKSCSDLLLVTSDLYTLEHGALIMNPKRMFATTPVIKLGDNFKKVQQFQKRFKSMPSMLELDHLTVSGDVTFGRGVTLRGTVIIVANEGQKIELPDGTILENKLVSGNLSIIFGGTTLYLDESPESQITGYNLHQWRTLAAALRRHPLQEWNNSIRLSWAFVRMYGSNWQQDTAGLTVGSKRLCWFRGMWKQGMLDSQLSWAVDLAEELQLMDPQSLQVQPLQQEILKNLSLLFEFVIMDRFKFSSGKTERGDNRPFKLKLYNYYAQPTPETVTYPERLQCALSGMDLPAASVIAAHLWKHEFAEHSMMLFSFNDIDDPRNGLLLYKLFEEAYNRAQICFIYHANEAVATWRCHVLDKSILPLIWTDYVNPTKGQPEGIQDQTVTMAMDELNKNGLRCFQDIDGRALCLSATRQPFKRVLNLNARLGHIRAKRGNKLPHPDWDFDEFHSDAMYASKKSLQTWAAGIG